jgi:hypothetical protein
MEMMTTRTTDSSPAMSVDDNEQQLEGALLFLDPSCPGPDTASKTHAEEEETKKEEPQSNHHHQGHYLSVIAGVSCLSRLMHLDLPQAQATMDDYLQSNSMLGTMLRRST